MRLLRVIASMDPAYGGPCQGIRNIVPTLERLGIQNEVVSMDDPASAYLGKDPFPIHAIGPSKGPWSYTPKLNTWLDDNLHRFDAVLIHGLWLHYGFATSRRVHHFRNAKSLTKVSDSIKLFVMPHGMLDPYFQRAPDRKLKALRNWIYWKLIEADVINGADGVFFTCDEELQLAKLPFSPYKPKKEVNVGYGIQPPPSYTPAMSEAFFEKCPQVRNHSYFLFLSRIHEKKGADLLVKAYLKVAKPGSPKLVIAGPGMETPYGQELKQLVENSKASDSIFFPGMLAGDAKWGAFYNGEAFVLPSHQENFGIAVVEALACGKFVLISNQVNIWREIEGSGGGIVAPNTLDGTEQLLSRWIKFSADEKLTAGEKARATFEKYFSIEPAAQRFVDGLKG